MTARPNRSDLALTGGGKAGTREWAVSIGIGPAKAGSNPLPAGLNVPPPKGACRPVSFPLYLSP